MHGGCFLCHAVSILCPIGISRERAPRTSEFRPLWILDCGNSWMDSKLGGWGLLSSFHEARGKGNRVQDHAGYHGLGLNRITDFDPEFAYRISAVIRPKVQVSAAVARRKRSEEDLVDRFEVAPTFTPVVPAMAVLTKAINVRMGSGQGEPKKSA